MRVNKTVAKKECMTAYITRKNLEYDERIKARTFGTKETSHGDVSLIKTEKDLLSLFCPSFSTTVFKTIKSTSRKRRVCRSYTTKDTAEPQMIFDEDVWMNKMKDPREFRNKKIKCYVVNDPLADPIFKDIVRAPKCMRCLRETVKCKQLDTLLSVLGHKANNYRFRSMLVRVLGFQWVKDCVELTKEEIIK